MQASTAGSVGQRPAKLPSIKLWEWVKSEQTHTRAKCACIHFGSTGKISRLLVENSCYQKVLKIAKKVAEEITIDDPEKEGDHIGPLFDKIQFDRVQNMIDVGIKEGASVLTGGLGKPHGLEDGWFVKPTIFYNVTNNMRVAQEEIFGRYCLL